MIETGLRDRVVVVTGGAAGIGRAVARRFAAEGAKVSAWDVTDAPALVAEIGSEHIDARRVDVTDAAAVDAAAAAVVERWGRIDVLVNNARFIGPGHMDRILDTPIDVLGKHMEGNAMAPVILTKLVLPQMIERGSGIIMTITSGAGRGDPPAPAGDGGWGLCYGMSKGAVNRLIGIIKLEHEQDGILAFNLHPGYIITERIIQDMAGFGFGTEGGAPPDVIGAAAAYLCTAPEARELNGQWIEGQELTARLGLLPGWDSPGSVSVPAGDGLDA